MSKIKRLSFEEKIKACELYDQGYGSLQSISDEFGINESGFKLMYFKYKNHGPESLKMQTKHQTYTKEFKEKVIESYNNKEGSYRELAIKYGNNNYSIINDWVLGYNNSNKTTYSGSGGVTMKGRKTTLDERIEIIGYLINNDIDYNNTTSYYNDSYKQVYNWNK